jgi:uncharacterized BrkB/YihY/UPF0761 family membrane protein
MSSVIEIIMLILFLFFMIFVFGGYHKSKFQQREKDHLIQEKEKNEKS